MNIVPLIRSDAQRAAELSARAFVNDPMERFLFPELAVYQQAWRELGPMKFERSLNCGTCWRTDNFNAVVRCIPPNAPVPSTNRSWHESMHRLVGARMDLADVVFSEQIPALFGGHKHWDLSSVAVEPGSQGQGIGSALVCYVVECAERDGFPVGLVASSLASRRLYERLGFSLLGEVAVPDGPPLFPMFNG